MLQINRPLVRTAYLHNKNTYVMQKSMQKPTTFFVQKDFSLKQIKYLQNSFWYLHVSKALQWKRMESEKEILCQKPKISIWQSKWDFEWHTKLLATQNRTKIIKKSVSVNLCHGVLSIKVFFVCLLPIVMDSSTQTVNQTVY